MADQRHDTEQRPSPEALLEAARREQTGVGRLRIFVGAAPGVGKTYEMLLQARAKRKDGADVVIGVVETHGRTETEALLEGLPVLPRKSVGYRGHAIEEMDLDAVIARHPKIVGTSALKMPDWSRPRRKSIRSLALPSTYNARNV
jgi:two-component system sensor histidine kinase KdpD